MKTLSRILMSALIMILPLTSFAQSNSGNGFGFGVINSKTEYGGSGMNQQKSDALKSQARGATTRTVVIENVSKNKWGETKVTRTEKTISAREANDLINDNHFGYNGNNNMKVTSHLNSMKFVVRNIGMTVGALSLFSMGNEVIASGKKFLKTKESSDRFSSYNKTSNFNSRIPATSSQKVTSSEQ